MVNAKKDDFEVTLKDELPRLALVLYAMGIFQLFVVVNQMDACKWSHKRFQRIVKAVSSLLEKTGLLEITEQN